MSRLIKWVKNKIRAFVYGRFFLFCLGLVIGASFVFCYFQGLDFLRDLNKGTRIVVVASAATLVQDAPQGEPAGLSGGPSIEEIADKVYRLESSGGKNDSCKAIGKVNGYGWRQNKTEWNCYNFTEEVRGYVIDYFERKLKSGVPLENALCIYNQGIDTAQCDYVNKYYSL